MARVLPRVVAKWWSPDEFWHKSKVFAKGKFESEDPLFAVCLFGLTRTFIDLFESRLHIEEDSLNKLLRYTCDWGYSELVQYLLEKGVRTDAEVEGTEVGDYKFLPLHYAASRGHQKVVQLLLENGANVSAPTAHGWTPLHSALTSENEEVVKLLIDRGADISAANSDGETPLHFAAKRTSEVVVKLLIDRGADISATDDFRRTPLHEAVIREHEVVANLLINRNADISAAPLYYATKLNYQAVAQLLLDNGADPLTACKPEDRRRRR
ncbi:ankyrin [Wilcoxina mikolae CBS 423.85]|nr:ankyrin [Wilcoxina mikolae CBS 423.85]